MSGLTRSDVFGRSLKIHNTSNNILEMDLQGNLFLNTKSIDSNIKETINLNSEQNLNLTTQTGVLTANTISGNIILRNGNYTDITSLDYAYENVNVDESNDTTSSDFYSYFSGNLINKPYTTKESVVALRDNSFLIESLTQNKPLTLYSNSGINNLSHGDIISITDNDYILQANRKINLTSIGFISFNSERLVSSVEEDTSFFSSTGNIILGGNGITNNGLMVNSNANNNFIGFGKTSTAQRSIDVEINHSANDNTHKNGITITNNSNSLNANSVPLNPEIELGNSNTNIKVDMGIGGDNQDINLRIVAKKININSITYLVPLNNFSYKSTDVGKVITWNDSTTSTILKIVNDTSDNLGIIAQLIINENDLAVSNFNFKIGYINRGNFGYLKTKTSSELSLGTNNKHYLNITGTGNVGINTDLPNASFEVKNTYGTSFNNNLVPTDIYTNGKMIQLNNGNTVLISNSKTGSAYSLLGFIYDSSENLISNFTIITGSTVEIQFGLDNLIDDKDLFVVAYCYSTAVPNYTTESNVFKNDGTIFINTLKVTKQHTGLNNSSYPNVKGFKFTKNTLDIAGYALVYNDLNSSDSEDTTLSTASTAIYSFVEIYGNTSSNLVSSFNTTKTLFTGTNSKLNSNIVNANINSMINKYVGIEVDDGNNTIILINYSRIEDSSNIYHHTYIQRFKLLFSSATYSLEREDFSSDNFIDINNKAGLSGYNNSKLEGANLKLVQTNANNNIYIIAFYEKNASGVKQKIHTGTLKLESGSSFDISISIKQTFTNETVANTLITDVPFISKKDEGEYLLGWVDGNIINYFQSNITKTITVSKTITSTGAQQIFVLCTNDLTGIYKDSTILWNNNNSSDTINYQSITLKKILSNFNILSVKNDNVDLKLTNEGAFTLTNSDKVTLNESLEIDKSNNKVSILAGKNLIITSNDNAGTATAGVEGQLNYKADKLYIYLNSQWKEVSLS